MDFVCLINQIFKYRAFKVKTMERKVLVLTSTFPRWKNDTTPTFVYELSNRLGQTNKMTILAPHAHKAKFHEKMENLDVYRFQYFFPNSIQKVAYGAGIIPNVKSSFLAKIQLPFFLFAEMVYSNLLVIKTKPDVIHAHWMIPQGFVGAILKKLYRKPLIITIHGSDLFPLKNPLFKLMQKFALNQCDICTVNSKATYNETVKRFPGAENKLIIRSMGVDTKKLRKKPKKNQKMKLILFVGRLNEQKGVEYLIRAMQKIKKQVKNANLLIIGEGEYKNYLENLAEELNIINSVDFAGALPFESIIYYYNAADVFVLPSVTSKTGTEGFGLVLLEAMAAAVPVVGTNSGGIPYIIKNRENGLLVKERDESELAGAVIELLKNKKLANKLRKNGLLFVNKHFSWDNVAQKFNDFYDMVT